MNLKFLFISEHADGSVIKQTQSDKSVVDPIRSRFYDVLNAPSPCIRFALTDGERAYGVDLITGEFAVNGVSFRLHSEQDLPLRDVELIFLRVHKQHTRVGATVGANGEFENITTEELPESPVTYQLGFKGVARDGSEFKRTMEFE